MNNKYLKLQSELKKSCYDFDDPIKWYEEIKRFFDLYFQNIFEKTKELGNEETYNNFKAIYDLLLLDFGKLIIDYDFEFRKHQLELLKLAKGSKLEEFNKINNLTEDFHYQSITYQIILVATFIFRFSNIENIQSKKFYSDFTEALRTVRKNANNESNQYTPKETLKNKIKKAKSELLKENEKITLTNISKKLGFKSISTLQSKLEKYHLKWRTI